MTRLLRQFQTLLECAALDPSRKISELELENHLEIEALVRDGVQTESQYECESRIHEIFETQAARTPNAVALEFGSEFISYAQLNGRANQVAKHLRDRGVEPGANVGLCLSRSVELIVGMLAILKAGAAYVPLDPESPQDRLKLLLEDCAVCHVVTNSDCGLRLPPLAQERLVLMDRQQVNVPLTDLQNPKTSGSSADLAYVMYTSGSTGVPKGTLIPHRAVLRLVRNTNYLQFSPDLVFLQYAPVCFDASTFEIWGALLNGARLIVAPPGILSLEQLGRLIRECRISTVWLTAGCSTRWSIIGSRTCAA
jgi:non-ribosomal peptide synthetase component F